MLEVDAFGSLTPWQQIASGCCRLRASSNGLTRTAGRGLKTMAVPILNGDGTVKASFRVSYPISREKEEIVEDKLLKSLVTVKDQSSLF